jgi:hypothetical protein
MNQVTKTMIDDTVRPQIATARLLSVVFVLALSALDHSNVVERLALQDVDAQVTFTSAMVPSGQNAGLHLVSDSPVSPATQAPLFEQDLFGNACPTSVHESNGEDRNCSFYFDWLSRRLYVAVKTASHQEGQDAGLLLAFDLNGNQAQGLQETDRIAIPSLLDPADRSVDPKAGVDTFVLMAGQTNNTLILVSRQQDNERGTGTLDRDVAYLIDTGAEGSLSIAAMGFMMPSPEVEIADVPDMATASLATMRDLLP